MNASSTKSEGHTPGPWTAELGDQTRTSEVWAGDMIVADVHGHVTRGCHADARLIAAAPDHHAVALELDRLMLVIESAVRWQDPSHSAAVVAMLKANRAAIAKAKGA